MEYDAATDAFKFYITFDPASFVVCDAEESGDNATLQTLFINKGGRAVRWGYLTVKKTEDGLRYLSNSVEEIPED